MKSLFRMLFVLVLILMCLPVHAFALTANLPGLKDPTYSAGSSYDAKSYRIAFGDEPYLEGNSVWPVYSAPSLSAIRGANGKASLATNGDVYTGGWSGAWLFVRYPKNNGGFRVGWVAKQDINRIIKRTKQCNFAYWTVTLEKDCMLTDDPLYESETLAYASRGETLTYLGYYQYGNGREYAYVQGEMDGRPICGFIPFNAIAW